MPAAMRTGHADEAVRITTHDGVELASHAWRPVAPTGVGVVIVHGFTASRRHPEVMALADRLSDDGHAVLSYDARGHGESSGHCTLGNDEHHDVAAAVESLRTEVDRVVVVGASAGAVAALRYAALGRDLAGVVTVSSPARWRMPRNVRGVLAAAMTQTGVGRRIVARRMNVRIADRWHRSVPPMELARQIEAPVAVVHGRDDRFIPAAEASLLHSAVAGPRRLLVVDGMGHAFDRPSRPAIGDAVHWALSVGR
jgi:uncharacterized protein